MERPAPSPAPESESAVPGLLPDAAPCPFCEGTETHLVNPFGGQLTVATYWCRGCRTAFDFIKWDEHDE